MGIVETTQANATVADFDRFRLRRFVEDLGDELATVNKPTPNDPVEVVSTIPTQASART